MTFECVLASTHSLSLPNPLLSIRFRAPSVVGWLKEADGPAVRDSPRKDRRINDSGVCPNSLAAGCPRTILPPHRTHVRCRSAVRQWDNLGHNEHTSRASGARIRAAHGTFSPYQYRFLIQRHSRLSARNNTLTHDKADYQDRKQERCTRRTLRQPKVTDVIDVHIWCSNRTESGRGNELKCYVRCTRTVLYCS